MFISENRGVYMFTGIIKETGKITDIRESPESKELVISCSVIRPGLCIGDSVAVDGCCLTVKRLTREGFAADISFSTLNSTTFKQIRPGEAVNLEDSLKLSDKLGGHFVMGHIDTTIKFLGIEKIGSSFKLTLELPQQYYANIAAKGSVAVDGISLTVAETGRDFFTAAIIPHTYENTCLKIKKPGELMNLEVDLISRYINRLMRSPEDENNNISKQQSDEILKEKLIKYGFFK
jgi:riboflavin synthase, alpha subunit